MLINTLGGLEGLPSLLIYQYEYTSANYHKMSPGQCEVRCACRTPSDIEHCRTPRQADGAGPDIRGIAENYWSRNSMGVITDHPQVDSWTMLAVWLSGYIHLISIGCDLVAHSLSPALCNNLYLIFGPPLAETWLGYGGYGWLWQVEVWGFQPVLTTKTCLWNFLMWHSHKDIVF